MVSVKEKASFRSQVRIKELNESEPFDEVSKEQPGLIKIDVL